MKKNKKIVSLLLAVIMILTLAAPMQVYAAVAMNRPKVTLAVKQKATLKVEGTSKKPVWSSSNAKVAAVSDGVVTAKKEGTATITAKIGSKKYTSKITVKGNYKKLYKKVLETTRDANWYYVLDLNRNGLPELIVASGDFFETYYVYTVLNGKAVLSGSFGVRGGVSHTLYYASASKGLIQENWTNTVGGIHDDLHTMSGSKLVNSKSAYKDMYGYETGANQSSRKKVSKSSYNSFIKKYFTVTKVCKMLQNTSANRVKSFG